MPVTCDGNQGPKAAHQPGNQAQVPGRICDIDWDMEFSEDGLLGGQLIIIFY